MKKFWKTTIMVLLLLGAALTLTGCGCGHYWTGNGRGYYNGPDSVNGHFQGRGHSGEYPQSYNY